MYGIENVECAIVCVGLALTFISAKQERKNSLKTQFTQTLFDLLR